MACTSRMQKRRAGCRDEGCDSAFEKTGVAGRDCWAGRVHKGSAWENCRRYRGLEAAGRRLRGRTGAGGRRERPRPCVQVVRRR